MWARGALTRALAACARRGGPAGIHAIGDRAVSALLHAIRGAREQAGPIRPGMFTIEHGGLISDRIADAAALGTPAGPLGPEHKISRAEALRLYTTAGAQFLGAPATATLVPGAPADLVAYPADPLTCPPEQSTGLAPAATVIGGRLAYRGTANTT